METTAYTTRDLGTVTIGTRTFAAELFTSSGRTTVFLTGPRGAVYFLRGFLGADNGLRQVVSFKSGNVLRDSRTQKEIRVYHIGDVIEMA